MNVPLKSEAASVSIPVMPVAAAAPPEKVVALTPKKPASRAAVAPNIAAFFARVAPPLGVLAALLAGEEILSSKAGATLPPPSRVFKDTKELIFDPFFDRGGIDKGLFWHLSASLQRVALGYTMAAIVGIALGTLVGQSVWAMRGLDP